MNLNKIVEDIEEGFQWPGFQLYSSYVAVADLPKFNLRKPRGFDGTHVKIWVVAFGEAGDQQKKYAFEFKPDKALRKAAEMKGQGQTQPPQPSAT